ncbi:MULTISPECIES: hypothetical protein [Jonquetella]|uniref:Uncharacterized protein n=1 Tax=Jonquetella anthropi DSM 22815 TaxID=885272 RepID=H0UMP1_9BACT|nr:MULTISPECIES: hypothetical protein [Jonquetella]EEX49292.1 hypothetical protein GCWU000246_00024 [Jonquetella anthropi E3_33 E1]EHM13744.1 hypothetical protein JonanDRAFT_1380 [Jonquetella anthropi DSM 22815]ERL23943.1 hypothetical protein HMPREF1249_0544 [Jonquetella sp. BV3C21]
MSVSGICRIETTLSLGGEEVPGRLYLLSCDCGDLLDVTYLFERDENPLKPRRGVICWMQTAFVFVHPVQPLQRLFRLRWPKRGWRELVRRVLAALDFLPGVVARAAFLACRRPMKAELVTLFSPPAAELAVAALRRMKLNPLCRVDADGSVTLCEMALPSVRLPAWRAFEWGMTGFVRVPAELLGYADGSSSICMN